MHVAAGNNYPFTPISLNQELLEGYIGMCFKEPKSRKYCQSHEGLESQTEMISGMEFVILSWSPHPFISLFSSLLLCFSLCICLILICLCLSLSLSVTDSVSFCFSVYIAKIYIPTLCPDPWVYIITSLIVNGIFEFKLQIPKERESCWPSFGQGIGQDHEANCPLNVAMSSEAMRGERGQAF